MQYRTHLWELTRVSQLTTCYFPKIAKKHTVWFLFGTINEGNAELNACCCFSTPPIHNLSPFFVRVSCVSLTLEKLGHGVLFITFLERRRAYFSSHLRCRRKVTHIKWISCSNSLTVCTYVLTIVLDNRLKICFLSLVSSLQVTSLACVLIGFLATLLSSFCKQSVLAPCRWLMLSLARWSHQWLSFGF
jgi:hypothetical protein